MKSAVMLDHDAAPPAPRASDDALLNWRYDHAWRVFNLNQELIRATDQKTYMLIVLSTLLISFASTNIDRFARYGLARDVGLPLLVAVAVAFFGFALATLLVRHVKPQHVQDPGLVFYGHILQQDAQAYRLRFASLTRAEALDDVLAQVISLATINHRKTTQYRRAWYCLAAEVIVFLGILALGRLVR